MANTFKVADFESTGTSTLNDVTISGDVTGGTWSPTTATITNLTATNITGTASTELLSCLLTGNNVYGRDTTDGSDNGYVILTGGSADGYSRSGRVIVSGNERTSFEGHVDICGGGTTGVINFRTNNDTDRGNVGTDGTLTWNYPITISTSSTAVQSIISTGSGNGSYLVHTTPLGSSFTGIAATGDVGAGNYIHTVPSGMEYRYYINNVLNGTIGTNGITSSQFHSTVTGGTPPFTVSTSANVALLNCSYLNGKTFEDPGPIGSTTASTGAFTIVTATRGDFTYVSTTTGAGVSTWTKWQNTTDNTIAYAGLDGTTLFGIQAGAMVVGTNGLGASTKDVVLAPGGSSVLSCSNVSGTKSTAMVGDLSVDGNITATGTVSGAVFDPQANNFKVDIDGGFYGNTTSDGSDNRYVLFCAADAGAVSRSGLVVCSGNERTTFGGNVEICAGDSAISGEVQFKTGNAVLRGTISRTGIWTIVSPISSTAVAAKILAASNTGSGNTTILRLGVGEGDLNAADIAFKYDSNSSNNNKVLIGFPGGSGQGERLVIDGQGNVTAASSLKTGGTNAALFQYGEADGMGWTLGNLPAGSTADDYDGTTLSYVKIGNMVQIFATIRINYTSFGGAATDIWFVSTGLPAGLTPTDQQVGQFFGYIVTDDGLINNVYLEAGDNGSGQLRIRIIKSIASTNPFAYNGYYQYDAGGGDLALTNISFSYLI